ncbi:MAG: hypothetical protein KAS04_00555 [Candidatus Aenigmarchaeota archaeon]|nr:hypothetical protein [Candidatus Aenigmarchaeota archaeon]
MKYWKDSKNEIRKVRKDKSMARSIYKMIEVRSKAIKLLDNEMFTSLKVESYYEIIKEIITAMMVIDGYKTLSHEVLIGYLKEFHDEFADSDIIFIDGLRQLRNKIAYKGFFVNIYYMERNEERLESLSNKLRDILKMKLERE